MANLARVLRAGALAAGMLCATLLGCAREEVADFSAPEIPGSDIVIAEVAGKPITAGFLYHKIRIQYPQMATSGPSLGRQVSETVKLVVSERCFTEFAASKGYDHDPELLRMLALSREHLIGRVVMSQGIGKRAEPSEEELRRAYQQDSLRFRLAATAWYRHILVDSESAARDARARLLRGEDFTELAQKISRDKVTAAQGGQLPPATAEGLVGHLGTLPELTAAALALPTGEISAPIRTRHGWHILKADAQRKEMQRSFEEMRPEIAQKLRSKRENQIYTDVMDSLKNALNVKFYDDAMEQFYLLQMNVEELFDTAQREQDAARKIAMYEQILSRFPEAERCPEALFMIGFERAERMADTTAAVAAFERFVKDYPEHEMASSARMMLEELRSPAR